MEPSSSSTPPPTTAPATTPSPPSTPSTSLNENRHTSVETTPSAEIPPVTRGFEVSSPPADDHGEDREEKDAKAKAGSGSRTRRILGSLTMPAKLKSHNSRGKHHHDAIPEETGGSNLHESKNAKAIATASTKITASTKATVHRHATDPGPKTQSDSVEVHDDHNDASSSTAGRGSEGGPGAQSEPELGDRESFESQSTAGARSSPAVAVASVRSSHGNTKRRARDAYGDENPTAPALSTSAPSDTVMPFLRDRSASLDADSYRVELASQTSTAAERDDDLSSAASSRASTPPNVRRGASSSNSSSLWDGSVPSFSTLDSTSARRTNRPRSRSSSLSPAVREIPKKKLQDRTSDEVRDSRSKATGGILTGFLGGKKRRQQQQRTELQEQEWRAAADAERRLKRERKQRRKAILEQFEASESLRRNRKQDETARLYSQSSNQPSKSDNTKTDEEIPAEDDWWAQLTEELASEAGDPAAKSPPASSRCISGEVSQDPASLVPAGEDDWWAAMTAELDADAEQPNIPKIDAGAVPREGNFVADDWWAQLTNELAAEETEPPEPSKSINDHPSKPSVSSSSEHASSLSGTGGQRGRYEYPSLAEIFAPSQSSSAAVSDRDDSNSDTSAKAKASVSKKHLTVSDTHSHRKEPHKSGSRRNKRRHGDSDSSSVRTNLATVSGDIDIASSVDPEDIQAAIAALSEFSDTTDQSTFTTDTDAPQHSAEHIRVRGEDGSSMDLPEWLHNRSKDEQIALLLRRVQDLERQAPQSVASTVEERSPFESENASSASASNVTFGHTRSGSSSSVLSDCITPPVMSRDSTNETFTSHSHGRARRRSAEYRENRRAATSETDAATSNQTVTGQQSQDANRHARHVEEMPPAVRRSYSVGSEIKQSGTSRLQLAVDLVQSEQSYVSKLRLCSVIFRAELQAGGLVPELLSKIFRNMDELLERHERFLEALRKRVEGFAEESDSLGDLFERRTDFLPPYREFISNHRAAMKIVEWMRGNDAHLASVMDRIAHDDIVNPQQCSFESALAAPASRLPYYERFVAELLELTPASHRDKVSLTGTLNRLGKVVKWSKHDQRNLEGLQRVRALIGRKAFEDERLGLSSRHYVKDGPLIICKNHVSTNSSASSGGKRPNIPRGSTQSGAKYRRLHLVLFQDLLVLCKERGLPVPVVIGRSSSDASAGEDAEFSRESNPVLSMQSAIPLDRATKFEQLANGQWQLQTSGRGKTATTLQFSADNGAMQNAAWARAVQTCLFKLH